MRFSGKIYTVQCMFSAIISFDFSRVYDNMSSCAVTPLQKKLLKLNREQTTKLNQQNCLMQKAGNKCMNSFPLRFNSGKKKAEILSLHIAPKVKITDCSKVVFFSTSMILVAEASTEDTMSLNFATCKMSACKRVIFQHLVPLNCTQ